MQVTVAKPPQLGRDLKAVAARADTGTLASVELAVGAGGVTAVRRAMSPRIPINPLAATAPATLKFSMDASMTGHLLGTELKLGTDLSSLLQNGQIFERAVTDPVSGVVTTRRMIEGAIGGAALSALLLSLRETSRAITNPALAAVALTVLGAVTWPYVADAQLTMKPDGTVTAKLGFKKP